jgi:hypothetical protein
VAWKELETLTPRTWTSCLVGRFSQMRTTRLSRRSHFYSDLNVRSLIHLTQAFVKGLRGSYGASVRRDLLTRSFVRVQEEAAGPVRYRDLCL